VQKKYNRGGNLQIYLEDSQMAKREEKPTPISASTTEETPRQKQWRLLQEGLKEKGATVSPKVVLPRVSTNGMAAYCLRPSCERVVSNGLPKK
jgi:hypothetical protein